MGRSRFLAVMENPPGRLPPLDGWEPTGYLAGTCDVITFDERFQIRVPPGIELHAEWRELADGIAHGLEQFEDVTEEEPPINPPVIVLKLHDRDPLLRDKFSRSAEYSQIMALGVDLKERNVI